jgi:energy-converting hydrogenase Eha subunit F
MRSASRKPAKPAPSRREEPPDGVDPIDLLPRPNPRRRLVPETPAERLARVGVPLEQEVPVNDAHATAAALAHKYRVEVRVAYSTSAPMARLTLVP